VTPAMLLGSNIIGMEFADGLLPPSSDTARDADGSEGLGEGTCCCWVTGARLGLSILLTDSPVTDGLGQSIIGGNVATAALPLPASPPPTGDSSMGGVVTGLVAPDFTKTST